MASNSKQFNNGEIVYVNGRPGVVEEENHDMDPNTLYAVKFQDKTIWCTAASMKRLQELTDKEFLEVLVNKLKKSPALVLDEDILRLCVIRDNF